MLEFKQGGRAAGLTRLGGAAALAAAALAGCGSADDGAQQSSAEATPPAAAQAQAPAPVRAEERAEVQTQGGAQAAALKIDLDQLKANGYAIGDQVIGDPNAPVTMVEYLDLTCPACKAFHDMTMPAVKRQYVESGKLRVITRESYGLRSALYASALARCAGPEKYHAFLGLLFERQDSYRSRDENVYLPALRRIGKLGFLSDDRIETCLNDNVFLRALYEDFQTNRKKDSIPATPFIIFQPGPDQQTVRGVIDPDQLGKIVDSFIEKKAAAE